MASLVSLVSKHYLSVGDEGEAVRAAQLAMGQAGFNSPLTGKFTSDFEAKVKRFQEQHGLTRDGKIGIATASMLDAPHEAVVEIAKPSVHSTGYPHDDTASMVKFYGNPAVNNNAWQAKNLVPVTPPWQMSYGNTPVKTIMFHRLCADALAKSFADIWSKYRSVDEIHRIGLHRFSGAYNFRVVRGSSRLSDHAFGAAIDIDGDRNPMTLDQGFKYPLAEVAPFFKANGAFWGGDFKHRRDGMHFQWAHE